MAKDTKSKKDKPKVEESHEERMKKRADERCKK